MTRLGNIGVAMNLGAGDGTKVIGIHAATPRQLNEAA